MTTFLQPQVGDTHPLAVDLRRIIARHIAAHPRSQQRHLGASEIGIPCARKLAFKLFGLEEINTSDRWLPTIGTAVHTWLAEALVADGPQWMTEVRVETGTCDAFNLATNTVLDWKVVGPTRLKDYRRKGPGPQYRTQIHTYGDGLVAQGATVEHVAIAFLPRNGPLDEMYLWSEPYDPEVGRAARTRLALITEIGMALGLGQDADERADAELIRRSFPSTDDMCRFCPWFSHAPDYGCPGHDKDKETTA